MENDLTYHFGNALLPDKNVPEHNAVYMSAASAFAGRFNLPNNKVWPAWTCRPSKIFLNDLEHKFDERLIQQLKRIDIKVPIATTNYWDGATKLFACALERRRHRCSFIW